MILELWPYITLEKNRLLICLLSYLDFFVSIISCLWISINFITIIIMVMQHPLVSSAGYIRNFHCLLSDFLFGSHFCISCYYTHPMHVLNLLVMVKYLSI